MPICKVHNIEKVKIFGTSLFKCTKCEKERRIASSNKRIEKNKALMAQSYSNENKVTKKGLKAKKGKIDKSLDAAWSELVKLMAGNKCEHCHKTKQLNSHHIYSRAKMTVRWYPDNGICLCVGCHIGVNFSAHKTPVEFINWLNNYKGSEFMEKLMIRANSHYKWTQFEKEILLKELNDKIKNYENTK